MIKNLLFGLSAILLAVAPALGQRTCATMSHLEKLEQQFPGTKAQLQQMDRKLANLQQLPGKQQQRSGAAVLTIPVVVHVVYNTAVQNISQAQIQSQIDVLNEDFGKLNADTVNIPGPFKNLAADTEIRFELAKRDPNGDPTNGITRTTTSKLSFLDDDNVKFASRGGKEGWDRNKYLNIWVCNLGGGLLGYAQFPGSGPVGTDGVVIGYNYFGRTGAVSAPFNKGRTATHEVGHWLALYHIWGDEPACSQDDQVADTPLQKDNNFGCPSFPKLTGSGGSCATTGSGAMFMNYMDYTDDACMNLYTLGQKNRMQSAIQTFRPTLATSNGLVPVVTLALDASIFKVEWPTGFSCFSSIAPRVVLKNRGTTTLTSATLTYRLDNGASLTYNWTGSLVSYATTTITLPALAVSPGTHTFTVATSLPNGQTDNDPTNDSQTVSFTTAVQSAGAALPFAESFENPGFPPAGWQLSNPDNDITWERTNQAAIDGTRSVRINNYDYNYIGERDELTMPSLNLSTVSGPALTFKVAYSPSSFGTPSDTLEVLASTDCGVTFQRIFRKGGQNLSTTTSPSFNPFVPNSGQWRLETINLSALSPKVSVILKFRNTTGYENNLYLDDIRVAGSLGTKDELTAAPLSVFPNPGTGKFTLQIPAEATNGVLRVTNALGQIIRQQTVTKAAGRELEIDLSQEADGIYCVQLTSGSQNYTRKLVLAK